MKISLTTGKLALAMAKSDAGFKELADHPDERVQALVAARLGTKSTLEETRTQRFIDISKRGKLPVPLRYYAAHTGRWGGDDKLNLQNIPRKSPLKTSIIPPKGYVLIDSDSSQIEARVLAWLSGQNDLVKAFDRGEDVYKMMASSIYNKRIDQITDEERFVGKTTILGAGYGMGAVKFQLQLKTFNVDLGQDFCRHVLKSYRSEFSHIPALWDEGHKSLEALSSEKLVTTTFGIQPQAVSILPGIGYDLPSGLPLKYMDLRATEVDERGRPQYIYSTRKGPVRIYGGKVVENLCQALARCVIGEQMLRIARRYKVVLTVHDAVACVVPIEEKEVAAAYVQECMRWRPEWAQTLPLNCEVKYGDSYGTTTKFKG
jgi:DNA polymerase